MAGAHSRYSPSSLYLTMACYGSLLMREKMPEEPDSEESIEGTVAHHVAMMLALGTPMKEGDKHALTARPGKPAYQPVEVDEDMIAGAELWVDTVGTEGAFETPLPCPDVHEDCWGTPDFWSWDAPTRVLTVWDYKYGHRYVEEFENVQMSAYASGLIRLLDLPEDTVVQIGIVQPRCYMSNQVRQWVTTAGKVIDIAKVAGKAVTEAIMGGYCRTGPHCIDCSARFNCKTLQFATNRALQFIQAAELNDPTPEALGTELMLLSAASDLLKARKNALEVMTESLIRGGTRVPGWEMKPGRSNLTWNDPVAVIAIGDTLGFDLRKEAKPITPTQALSKKLFDEESIKTLASRPPAALKLAAVSNVATRKIFGA